MATEERWVDVGEVAKHIGVRRESIYRWIDKKGMKGEKSMKGVPQSIRSALAAEVARQGWTLTELAQLTGIAQPHLGEFLRGVRDWNTRTADRLIAALGLVVTRGPAETSGRRSGFIAKGAKAP